MKLTIKALRTKNPWHGAAGLGIEYTGDANPITHGGVWYSLADYANDYCEAVRVQSSEGVTWVESGAINLLDGEELDAAMDCIGARDAWSNAEFDDIQQAQIRVEASLAYAGMEIDHTETFKDKNDGMGGEQPEYQIAKALVPLINALAPGYGATREELAELVISVRNYIDDDCRAYEDDDKPGILLTVATDGLGKWSYQTGDTSFTGGAYGLPLWASVAVLRRGKISDIVNDIYRQWAE